MLVSVYFSIYNNCFVEVFFSLSIFVHNVHTIYINNYLKPNKLVVNYVNTRIDYHNNVA